MRQLLLKTIHLAGPINNEDIENEASTIKKLRTEAAHLNLVKIFRHGEWFPIYAGMFLFQST